MFLSSNSAILPPRPVIRALLPLIPPRPIFALLPTIRPRIVRLARLLLLLLVDLDKPVVLAVLVLALVAPLGHPLAGRFFVDHLAVALLVLDALLGGEALPFSGLLGCGDGLLAGQWGRGRGEDEVHALAVGLDLAGGEQLVYEGLCGVAGGGGENLFRGSGGHGIGVVGEEVAQVEGEGRGLVDGDGAGACQCGGGGGAVRETSYSLPDMVESASDAAPLVLGDLTSIAPPLICSASCECVGDAPLRTTPPSISVSDIACGGVVLERVDCSSRAGRGKMISKKVRRPCSPPRILVASPAASAALCGTPRHDRHAARDMPPQPLPAVH